jgi:hypothetical protein
VWGQRKMSQVLGMFWLLILTCYGLFSLGGHFETYKTFNSSIFQFFSGHGEPQITETTDTESVDTGAQLYVCSISSNTPYYMRY